LNSKDLNLTDSDFKSGDECLSEFIDAETQSFKIFGNELSMLCEKNNIIHEDRWWEKPETNFLNNLEQSKAHEFFEFNSSFPLFLDNKDLGLSYSMLKASKI
jgi:hypothetical protein